MTKRAFWHTAWFQACTPCVTACSLEQQSKNERPGSGVLRKVHSHTSNLSGGCSRHPRQPEMAKATFPAEAVPLYGKDLRFNAGQKYQKWGKTHRGRYSLGSIPYSQDNYAFSSECLSLYVVSEPTAMSESPSNEFSIQFHFKFQDINT